MTCYIKKSTNSRTYFTSFEIEMDDDASVIFSRFSYFAAWADHSCHIEPAKMAQKNFGGFILV